MPHEQQQLCPWYPDCIAFHVCVPLEISARFLFPIQLFCYGLNEQPHIFFSLMHYTLFSFFSLTLRVGHQLETVCRAEKQSLRCIAIKSMIMVINVWDFLHLVSTDVTASQRADSSQPVCCFWPASQLALLFCTAIHFVSVLCYYSVII